MSKLLERKIFLYVTDAVAEIFLHKTDTIVCHERIFEIIVKFQSKYNYFIAKNIF